MTDKEALRRQALSARARKGDADALTRHLKSALLPFRGQILAGYWPIRDEADPRPAMAAHDGQLCLPVVTGRDQPLTFRAWDGADLVPGMYGTAHPPESRPALQPTVLIVPVAGFDRQGNRLGYGGGYYDRTLQMLRHTVPVRAIGLAFAVQELPLIPTGPFDQPLDLIVTDQGTIRPQRPNSKNL